MVGDRLVGRGVSAEAWEERKISMTVFVSLPEEKKKKNPAQGSPLSSYGGGSDGTHGGFTGYLKLVYPRPTVAPIGIAPAGSGGGGPSFGGGEIGRAHV